MADEMNILILSCGTRNKIVQYFKAAVGSRGKVYATDCSLLAPALYEADEYVIVPKLGDLGYLEVVLEICRKYRIRGVLSLIDPELSFLAQNREAFLAIGTTPIVSDYDVVERCFNKFAMYQYIVENNFPTIPSYQEPEVFYRAKEAGEIDFPVFVKPVCGSASININKIDSEEELTVLLARYPDLMIQKFMGGSELGVDAYIDMISGDVVAVFIKEKLKMRAGETDKAVSVKDHELMGLIEQFVKKSGFRGIIDIDIFKSGDSYYLSEVNPRFGGGYPHAYACGVDIPTMIVNNLMGIVNVPEVGAYEAGIYMMKYNEIKISRQDLKSSCNVEV